MSGSTDKMQLHWLQNSRLSNPWIRFLTNSYQNKYNLIYFRKIPISQVKAKVFPLKKVVVN